MGCSCGIDAGTALMAAETGRATSLEGAADLWSYTCDYQAAVIEGHARLRELFEQLVRHRLGPDVLEKQGHGGFVLEYAVCCSKRKCVGCRWTTRDGGNPAYFFKIYLAVISARRQSAGDRAPSATGAEKQEWGGVRTVGRGFHRLVHGSVGNNACRSEASAVPRAAAGHLHRRLPARPGRPGGPLWHSRQQLWPSWAAGWRWSVGRFAAREGDGDGDGREELTPLVWIPGGTGRLAFVGMVGGGTAVTETGAMAAAAAAAAWNEISRSELSPDREAARLLGSVLSGQGSGAMQTARADHRSST